MQTHALIQLIAGMVSLVLCVMLLKFRQRAIRYFAACANRAHELDSNTRGSIPDMLAAAAAEPAKRRAEIAQAEDQIARIKAGETWIQEQ